MCGWSSLVWCDVFWRERGGEGEGEEEGEGEREEACVFCDCDRFW